MILLIFLLGIALTSVNCQNASAVTCTARFIHFGKIVETLNIDDASEMIEFKNTCDSLKFCFASYLSDDELAIQFVATAKDYCDAMNYIVTEFADCKLKLKGSECFATWIPFPNSVNGQKFDSIEKFGNFKEACVEYFGKNECTRDEIIEHCGEKYWLGFRDYFMPIGTQLFGCDFGHLL